MFRLSVASVLALFGVAAASSCPAYQLYGDYTVTPSSLSAGQQFTVVSNFTCSNDPQFPVKPRFIDYYIVDTSSTLEGWTYLTRRTSPPVVDAFNLTLPEGYWATGQATGATYALRPLVIYPDPAHAGLLDTYTHPYDGVPLQISGN